jgi:hypothetical protein
LHRNRPGDQQKWTEAPEINPQSYSHLVAPKIHWRKDIFFSKWCWENWISTCRALKVDFYFSPYAKHNWNWIKGLSEWPQTLKPLEDIQKSTQIGFSIIT